MKKIGLDQKIDMAKKFLKYRNTLNQFPYQSYNAIKEYQWKRIKKIVADAYLHVPFYRNKYKGIKVDPLNLKDYSEFEQLPTITKNDLANHELEFIDDRYNVKDLICSKTSGTSGVFLDIYCPESMFVEEELQVLRMLKELCPQYNLFSREVLVYTSEYPVSSILGFYKAYYINNLESATKIFNFIKSKKPTVVAIYPSILREIITKVDYDFKSLGIKLILTNSEQSTQMERDHFATTFGCEVRDEFSSEELQSIAYQCNNFSYHEVSDCSYIEILDIDDDICVNENKIGEIVGTCLINPAMPLIRYRQGDLAKKINAACPCGKHTPIIGQLMGRNNASFIDKFGNIIPSGKLLDWSYSLVLENHFPINDFQIIQETKEKITIKVVISADNESPDITTQICDAFVKVFGDRFMIQVESVPMIEKTASGKCHSIVSLIE